MRQRVETLTEMWRYRAKELQPYATAAAEAFSRAASELEAALKDDASELLTVSEAARESGYSERRLRELIQTGQLPAVNGKGPARVARADLPRRARRRDGSARYDPARDAAGLLDKLRRN